MLDVRINMASNSHSSRTVNFSEEEKLLLAELGREFPEVEKQGKSLGCNSKQIQLAKYERNKT